MESVHRFLQQLAYLQPYPQIWQSGRLRTAAMQFASKNVNSLMRPTLMSMKRKQSRKRRTPEQISEQMRSIRKKNTRPEMIVRRLAHGMGYRFRLHRADLPGTPDLVFPSRRKIIQVHGCFWHQHTCKLGRRQPSTNKGYWLPKLARNVERDRVCRQAVKALGWQSFVIWECQTRDLASIARAIRGFLG